MKTDIIIVGNGQSILEVENGSKIDSYNTVVRFNDFETKGYEKHTGIKADVLATCTLINYTDLSMFNQVICYLLHKDHHHFNADLWDSPNIIAKLDKNYAAMVAFHVGLAPKSWPSTGLATICFYLSYGHKITITGFDNFKLGYYDYFGHTEDPGGNRHDGGKQAEFIDKMVKQGKITIL